MVWAKGAGGSGRDFGRGIAVDASGNSYVTGEIGGSANFDGITLSTGRFFVAKYDANGNVVWAKSVSGTDVGRGIAVDAAGSSYVTGGRSGSQMNPHDIFVVKYDASGNAVWDKGAGGPQSGDEGLGIAVDASGNSYVTGYFNSTATFDGTTLTGTNPNMFVVKYSQPGAGTISGNVSADGSGLSGVIVKLLDNQNPTIVIDETTTDAQGDYAFNDVPAGTYQVMVVEPLSYLADQNFVVTNLQGGTNTVNFVLAQFIAKNKARPRGYWKHQFDVYVLNRGNAQESQSDLQIYTNTVAMRYNPFFSIFAAATDGIDDFADWQTILSAKGNALMVDQAKGWLAALVLDIMSLKLSQPEVVSADGKTAGDALTYVSELILDGNPANDELARDIAELVSTQQTVGAGIINPSQSILYKTADGEILESPLPEQFVLHQNYPNPFNPETEIRFQLPEDGHVTLTIYNTLGQAVRTLVDMSYQAGYHQAPWDGKDSSGNDVTSGIYLYRIQAGTFSDIKQMTLLR